MAFKFLDLAGLTYLTNKLKELLDAKQATITGAATTITGNNLTASRALVSNDSGKVAVSDVTASELGYLDGVTSSIQTQLNGKAASDHAHSASEITSLRSFLAGGSDATWLAAGANLDDCTDTSKVYCASYDVVTSGITNCPTSLGFKMFVIGGYSGTRYHQILFPGGSTGAIFTRSYNGTWSEWKPLHPSLSGLGITATADQINSAITTALEGTSPITTAGTGDAYTVTVPGITALTAGISFTMIPHVASTTNKPTLNVNGLGAKNLRQPLTTNTTATTTADSNSWLTANKPVRVMYDGTLWKTVDIPRPSAAYLYGSVPVPHGGTGLESVTAGNFLVGNGTEDMVQKTPAEVLAAIGALQVDGIGTAIPSGSDLDSYTTPGKYNAGTSAIASSLTNPPTTTTGFSLIVMDNYVSGRVEQFAFDNTNGIYQRYYNGTTWTAWSRMLRNILTTSEYGTTLPSTATKGRIFFKKV